MEAQGGAGTGETRLLMGGQPIASPCRTEVSGMRAGGRAEGRGSGWIPRQ